MRSAAAAGFTQVEFWTTTDKDLEEVERALRETGITVTDFVSEPTGRLVDPATHTEFLEGVERSTRVATRLNARNVIVLSGDTIPNADRRRQLEAITQALSRAAPIASKADVGLLLEPLNTLADHPGYFLDSTVEALDVIRNVNQPAVRLLYDMYHSIVMGEEPAEVLAGSGHLVGHVHVADLPGRHEPRYRKGRLGAPIGGAARSGLCRAHRAGVHAKPGYAVEPRVHSGVGSLMPVVQELEPEPLRRGSAKSDQYGHRLAGSSCYACVVFRDRCIWPVLRGV